MRSWTGKVFRVCAGIVVLGLLAALALAGMFGVQHLAENPEDKRLIQEIRRSPAGGGAVARPGAPSESLEPGSGLGTVVLSLSSAAVSVKAGPAGEPIRVESSFDPDVYRLEQAYEENGEGGWIYRIDFHEKRLFHVSVVSVWLGRRSPEVSVVIPRDLPLALEATMHGGYLSFDLAGLALTRATIELDRGVLGLTVSEPLPLPMESLSLKGRMGTMAVSSLGNASPRKLSVQHGLGAASVDLGGKWRVDADVEFETAFGSGELRLPRDVRIEGLDWDVSRLIESAGEEIPPPTLRISTHFDMGDIRVVE